MCLRILREALVSLQLAKLKGRLWLEQFGSLNEIILKICEDFPENEAKDVALTLSCNDIMCFKFFGQIPCNL